MKRLIQSLLFLFASPCLVAYGAGQPDPMSPGSYTQPAVQNLVQLVNDAASRVRTEGEKAFAEFRTPGRWFRRDQGLYLFIFDLEGNQVVNAGFPELETNRLDWRDAWGKPLFRLGIAKFSPSIEDRHFWWFHYVWYKPGESKESWKSAYMVRTKAPSGKVYVVACGLYDLAVEPLWVELLVAEAADLVKAIGVQAYAVISSRQYQFMYRDTYVFVLDESGTELAAAAFPELIGKNLLELEDFPFKAQIREEIRFAKARGEGWMQGAWPLPGEREPREEAIYLKSVPLHGRLHIFGSAIYKADAAKNDPRRRD